MEEGSKDDILWVFICGPHSTGKTTLLNDLRPHLGNVLTVEEIAREKIRNHGWSRDDFSPDKYPEVFQQLNKEILAEQIKTDMNCSAHGQDYISDRALDPMVYCDFYIGSEAKEKLRQLEGIDRFLDSLRKSLVVLVSPHAECIHSDPEGMPASLEELRRLYDKFVEELQHNGIEFVELTQLDRQERIDLVLKEIEKFKHKKTAVTGQAS